MRGVSNMLNDSSSITRENEFDIFGKNVGAQLKSMPLQDALQAQRHIFNYITKLRLQHLDILRGHSPNSKYCESPSPSRNYYTSGEDQTPSPEFIIVSENKSNHIRK